ncbi:alpha,alpha-trehalose-phosphate synthase (UDP-forming) [Caulobacter sp. SLTY]|uniref:alpha,alpha-trehalose-phosphate synthase (UDP-forming) n=1 Tax=Caulobacter sp. SLTY TaxID=2683262 RepID=UPI00141248E9|nr:alpha,alpha-trehalose-phosphate synthase (UDP-forming) [Caulobacter sp. SLTY]NBB16311.1 alpha,alpha-trehalose-phosphate synthase (UDP-forming) [Caulobacter sp. SLTY]
MSRLIVVSNRVGLSRDVGGGAVGGLSAALTAALRQSQGVWFGWSGETVEKFNGQLALDRVGDVTVARIDLEPRDIEEYYNGYSNNTLWPLFHNRIDLTHYDRASADGYARVNQRFAEALRSVVGPNDVIWVHDYHMIPLARELRKLGFRNRIGFFLHIPWPARQLLTTLPGHQALTDALFDYDLVGFHTDEWLSAFTGYLRNERGIEVDAEGSVESAGRRTRLGVFPIGVHAADFAPENASEASIQAQKRMEESLSGRQMIIGVDRLDYSKGLEERFIAYEQFLHDHPDQREKVFMLQIATPSRDAVEAYQDLRGRLDAVAGRINGAFATLDWVPLRYVNSGFRQDELAGVYRSARVALITPLRDGMNLVAKEYVAAQDPADPGVLILSRFAGAAAQMKEALIVNPYDREEMAQAIHRALTMDPAERILRWRALKDGLERESLDGWWQSYLETLGATPRPAPKIVRVAGTAP